jgi:hypothetical protein
MKEPGSDCENISHQLMKEVSNSDIEFSLTNQFRLVSVLQITMTTVKIFIEKYILKQWSFAVYRVGHSHHVVGQPLGHCTGNII